ncbi:hypothetical protein STPYR_10927 [uncultured Stenotrophomonas sp.]|uniref:Transmembrane protein n=1 Tax=uncultured Stenotrophomonas sp. TaxID=165438 RepID=A0A1Y5Q7Y3_9GAMM|nr:hypothetical protein STPYR_10927 [uncultured Stenotrophomonas sp.]
MQLDISPFLSVIYRFTFVLFFAIAVGLVAAFFSSGLGKRRRRAVMQLAFTATLVLGALLFVL